MSKSELPLPTKEINKAEKEVTILVAGTRKFQIKDEKGVVKATEILSQNKSTFKAIEKARKVLVKPLQDHVKMINAEFKKRTAPLLVMETNIKRLVADFVLDQERKEQKEQERLAKLHKNRVKRADEKGKDTSSMVAPSVEKRDTTVQTESGKIDTVKVWKYEVMEEVDVPVDYKMVDDQKVRQAISDGVREIKGLHIFEDVQVRVSAK